MFETKLTALVLSVYIHTTSERIYFLNQVNLLHPDVEFSLIEQFLFFQGNYQEYWKY